MPDFSAFKSPGPYHIISYGTLLGTTVFESCFAGIIAFNTIPRPQFSLLRNRIFPVYFSVQTTLPVVLALTYPGSGLPLGTASGLAGTFAEVNRWKVLAPLATMFVTALTNLVLIRPATNNVMRQRNLQETRDGKKSYDPAPHSKEMQKLNKAFGRIHGASALLNMGTLLATLWYGFNLAERIQ
ncbi:Uncharacterized protein BP5553_00699 [Venustampulla echinocandica]|uniref:TMEM205-like domain-containing protein n=1 Tax=Venustampulla echinocandica TaxID=2656787 RepID=A0A370TYX6_9HELO|nr:Uncharacterized protein BP5553_00699 [Venustampulla echinocandica]RDL40720.1 Uncharacterized protein BP5553_00699 [Venustampulla echinocandica]